MPASATTPESGPTRARRPRGKRTLRLVTAAVCTLVAAEVGARVTHDSFGSSPMYHSVEADRKARAMAELSPESIDVVFVGASVVAVGVDPVIFEEASGLRGYNAALGFAKLDLTAAWTENVVLDRIRPDVVVIGISSYDLLNEDTAGQVALFEDSHGGLRDSGDESLLQRGDRWMFEHSDLWRWRNRFRDPTAWLDAVRGDAPVDVWAAHTTPNGYNDYYEGVRAGDDELVGPVLAPWSDRIDVSDQLTSLLDAVEASGARPVLVNLPMTQAHIDDHPNGAEDYRSYEAWLRDFAAQAGVSLLFYDTADRELFGDIVHLNEVGAARFSTHLADDVQRLGDPPDAGPRPDDDSVAEFGDPLPPTPHLDIDEP